MGLWYRVFGANDVLPAPGAILEALGGGARGDFADDGAGWYAAALHVGDGTPLHLERFLATEEGIRAELNTWAAWLETCDYSPQHAALMERVIQTKQLFTLRRPIDHADEVLVERLCEGLCRFLAGATEGLWQADDRGFFAADGALLLQEY
jgi:hypothetical protein